jgi:hypothetical protein
VLVVEFLLFDFYFISFGWDSLFFIVYVGCFYIFILSEWISYTILFIIFSLQIDILWWHFCSNFNFTSTLFLFCSPILYWLSCSCCCFLFCCCWKYYVEGSLIPNLFYFCFASPFLMISFMILTAESHTECNCADTSTQLSRVVDTCP